LASVWLRPPTSGTSARKRLGCSAKRTKIVVDSNQDLGYTLSMLDGRAEVRQMDSQNVCECGTVIENEKAEMCGDCFNDIYEGCDCDFCDDADCYCRDGDE